MALDFYRTVGGRKFIDHTVPRLAKAFEQQNELVQQQLEQQETIIEQNKRLLEQKETIIQQNQQMIALLEQLAQK